MGKNKDQKNKAPARDVMFALLVVLCLVMFFPGEGFADDAPLTKADGLYIAYGSSFMQDECGNSALGERFREALIAKMESCPFTAEAKLGFYKMITLDMSRTLSKMYSLITTHPVTVPPKEKYCEELNDWDASILQKKLSEYDAGKIKLADVVVKPSGEPVDCMEISKSAYEGSDSNQISAPAKLHAPSGQ